MSEEGGDIVRTVASGAAEESSTRPAGTSPTRPGRPARKLDGDEEEAGNWA